MPSFVFVFVFVLDFARNIEDEDEDEDENEDDVARKVFTHSVTRAATNYRSHSPITKSREPRMLTTSLIMWPGRIFGRMLRLMKLGLRIFSR